MDMNNFDTAYTIRWWDALLADDERMARWLQKLQKTEYSGYGDNLAAIDQWAGDNMAAIGILKATASDELKHSDLLVEVLNGRGLSTETQPPESIYWAEMDKEIIDLKTCAAVFHLGEQLAADRFRVIYNHPGTPKDIMAFLKIALPDEEYHARSFKWLTDDPTLARILLAHQRIVAKLKGE